MAKSNVQIINRARAAVLKMAAYKSARSLYEAGDDVVFLDANELPVEPFIGAKNYSHYPSQQPRKLIEAMATLYGVAPRNIMVSRGADEAIDILVRSFCETGADNIITCPPTFAMYGQAAALQGIENRIVPLGNGFALDRAAIEKAADDNTKIIFVCTPNNPTGNVIDPAEIEALCKAFAGKALIVADETYMEFAGEEYSVTPQIEDFDNLVVLRTLSKAYAAAGLRCGAALAHRDVIALLRKVLPPYPLPQPVVEAALATLSDKNKARLARVRDDVLAVRDRFVASLATVDGMIEIYPSATNFVLVKVKDAEAMMKKAQEAGFILRNQSSQPGLENCLRISMGSAAQMEELLAALKGAMCRRRVGAGRSAHVTRRTKETAISVKVNLDQSGPVSIATGIGFYDHMLEQIARHGGFALSLECDGDLEIDPHHTVEDCAIALGQALREALGDKAGIGRYGFTLPMDEALASAVIDLSGRFYLRFKGDFPEGMAGDLPTDMVEHVFRSLAENLGATVHIDVEGDNTHHMVEGCFKAFGRAMRMAIRKEGDELPSTKGML